MRQRILFLFLAGLLAGSTVDAEDTVLSLEDFLHRAARSDTRFEEILIDTLTLKYEKRLRLPPRDLVVQLKQELNLFIDDGRADGDTEIGLNRLFPFSGTKLQAAYEVSPTADKDITPSGLSLQVTQDIAENAFGRSTRLLDQIIGLEIDVARHQIAEAYEDYFAAILTAFFDWRAAYENLEVGQSSYEENLKLLDNIRDRQKRDVALPIDVNKTTLNVMSTKDRLVELEETYASRTYLIEQVIRGQPGERFIPAPAPLPVRTPLAFEEDFSRFRDESRTFRILEKLEERSDLQVDRDADDLLPSIKFLAGLKVRGQDYGIEDGENLVFAGISLDWPLPGEVDQAELEVAKIERDRSGLITENTRFQLYTSLKSLAAQIDRERRLLETAEERLRLAQAILEQETENYSFGKVTLNDYIQAVNVRDSQRFNQVRHDVQQKVLTVEWLRLMDRLVSEQDILELSP